MIAGAGLTTPIAYRWKTQINENAKQPAFAHELPELDHNELAGWEGAQEVGRFSAVFLDDSDAHPRVKERMELTERLIAGNAAASFAARDARPDDDRARRSRWCCSGISSRSTSPPLRGVDPGPVKAIEELKSALAKR